MIYASTTVLIINLDLDLDLGSLSTPSHHALCFAVLHNNGTAILPSPTSGRGNATATVPGSRAGGS
jgi:hypothetical protein